jgi:hypothetical protein
MAVRGPNAFLGALLALALGCDGPREVTIEVTVPDLDGVEHPAADLPIVILPYDRDSLLGVLEARAASSRPHMRALDSLFSAFQVDYLAFARAAHQVARFHDSMALLKGTLDTLDRSTEDYHTWFQVFAQLKDSLARSERHRDEAAGELRRARTAFVPLSDSLRQEVRQWEQETFRDYDDMVADLIKDSGRNGLRDTTATDGHATVALGRGAWWVYARAWDVENPNSEWYWNVAVTRDTVRLNSQNGLRLPSY